jgi:hypothetical protein
LYNDTETRELHFVVNGKEPEPEKLTDNKKLKFKAFRCQPGSLNPGCNTDVVIAAECPESDRKWSDPASWDKEKDPTLRKAGILAG